MLAISLLKDLDIELFDIGYSYLNSDIDKKVYFIYSRGFGPKAEDAFKVYFKLIYGLKSDVASITNNMASNCTDILRFKEFIYELDTWMKTPVKVGGLKYYEYISAHADEIITISKNCDKIIKGLEETYTLGRLKVIFDKNPL